MKGDYDQAMSLLASVDLERQLAFDGSGYIAVSADTVFFPGTTQPIRPFDRNRDWAIPGTSDVATNAQWQVAATNFARKYNRARDHK
jgi:hypothetical protein